MDRQYKSADTVTVYQSNKDEKPMATFQDKPFSMHGFDYYEYKGEMYPGFYDVDTEQAYILLDQPQFKRIAK